MLADLYYAALARGHCSGLRTLSACLLYVKCRAHYKVLDLQLTSTASLHTACSTLFTRYGLLLTSSGYYSLDSFI